MVYRLALIVGVFLLPCCPCVSWAGGETSNRHDTGIRTLSPAEEAIEHSAAVTQALRETCERAFETIAREQTKYARMTDVVRPVKDRFGDPMYTWYGSRPYAGSPCYSGPAYTASFERAEPPLLPDSEYRGYYRDAYSHPQAPSRTDVVLPPGATHGNFQSGMYWSPASQSPYLQRPMINNRW